MRAVLSRLPKIIGACLVGLAVLAVFAVASGAVKLHWANPSAAEKRTRRAKEALAVELVDGQPDSLLVPEDVRKSLGIRKATSIKSRSLRSRPERGPW